MSEGGRQGSTQRSVARAVYAEEYNQRSVVRGAYSKECSERRVVRAVKVRYMKGRLE